MREKVDTELLLAKLPKEDQEQLLEVFELLEELQSLGIGPTRPSPIMPYGEAHRLRKRDSVFST